jgi:tetratricopeptide (TPR) repeat protein
MAFNEVIEYSPRIEDQAAEIYAAAGWFYATCPKDIFRDGKKSLEYAKKALEMDAQSYSVRKSVAAAYAEVGDFDLAVTSQSKLVEMMANEKKSSADELKKAEAILELYKSKKPYRDVNE